LAASFDYELRENNVVKNIRLAADFRRRAAEARRMADKASDPHEKQDCQIAANSDPLFRVEERPL
jgi:hypothetical protein